jgi:hypothetical protein
MNMSKEVEDGVWMNVPTLNIYDMSLRVENLRQMGERLRRAVWDFDACMGRKDVKWGVGLV